MNLYYSEIIKMAIIIFTVVSCSCFYFGNKISDNLRVKVISVLSVLFIINILLLFLLGISRIPEHMILMPAKYLTYVSIVEVTAAFVLTKFCEQEVNLIEKNDIR